MPKQKLVSRRSAQGAGGTAVKQANIVLTLIENRTAYLIVQAQAVANTALAVAATQTPRHAFLRAIAEDRTVALANDDPRPGALCPALGDLGTRKPRNSGDGSSFARSEVCPSK